jgi:medium-chain acyl-[acyl-carrier-protein] hydrolase
LAAKAARTRRTETLKRASGPPSIRLICVPHAGGNPELFWPWVDRLAPNIELLAVRLPGHGPRIADRTFDQWDALLADTFEGLEEYLHEPNALFGHCFGGRVAYEFLQFATRHIGAGACTQRLFVSACRSPDAPHRGRYVHALPDRELRDALRQRGAPDEVLQNDAVMRLVLPAVRSEFRLAELWDDRHQTGVDVPITAIHGRDDPEDGLLSMKGWEAFSTKQCELVEVPGDHFFPSSDPAPLLDVINSRLGGRLGEAKGLGGGTGDSCAG